MNEVLRLFCFEQTLFQIVTKEDNTMFSLITTNPKSSREELSALTEDNVENENDSEHQIVCQKSFQTGEPAIICDVKPSRKYQNS